MNAISNGMIVELDVVMHLNFMCYETDFDLVTSSELGSQSQLWQTVWYVANGNIISGAGKETVISICRHLVTNSWP